MQPRCDQCDSVTVNGAYCHEYGCPNRSRVYNQDKNQWVLPFNDSRSTPKLDETPCRGGLSPAVSCSRRNTADDQTEYSHRHFQARCRREFREITETLVTLQQIVGGYIEMFSISTDDLVLTCNEEGKIMGLSLIAISADRVVLQTRW